MARRLAWLPLALVLAGCAGTGAPHVEILTGAPSAEEPDAPPAVEPVVRFIAWGDTGTGLEDQYRVAAAAEAVCATKGCDLVLQLGDNIYPDGVESVTDDEFRRKFEEPYANFSIPFLVALGNHDVGTNVSWQGRLMDKGDLQVVYDAASSRWRMPDRYYSERFGHVEFFALDLTSHAGAPGGWIPARLQDEQARWIDEALGQSDATWRFAFSHFPYVSDGKHGNAGGYDGEPGKGSGVKKFVEKHLCGRVDVYFAGHDHTLQWAQPAPGCEATEFVVSGAGAKPEKLATAQVPSYFKQGATLGFFWFEARGDTLVGEAYDATGTVLFRRVVEKPSPARAGES